MKTYFSLFLVTIALALQGCSKAPPTAQEQAAIDAAVAWLELVDKGSYAESWDESAGVFRAAVPKDRWVSSLTSVRSPLGIVESRNVTGHEFLTSLPNTPKGEYVVIQFKTHFGNKKGAVETVTPMVDPDGKWRVSGYYIK